MIMYNVLLSSIDLDRGLSQPLAKNVVVAVWDVQELHSAGSKILDGGDDVKRPGGVTWLGWLISSRYIDREVRTIMTFSMPASAMIVKVIISI